MQLRPDRCQCRGQYPFPPNANQRSCHRSPKKNRTPSSASARTNPSRHTTPQTSSKLLILVPITHTGKRKTQARFQIPSNNPMQSGNPRKNSCRGYLQVSFPNCRSLSCTEHRRCRFSCRTAYGVPCASVTRWMLYFRHSNNTWMSLPVSSELFPVKVISIPRFEQSVF